MGGLGVGGVRIRFSEKKSGSGYLLKNRVHIGINNQYANPGYTRRRQQFVRYD